MFSQKRMSPDPDTPAGGPTSADALRRANEASPGQATGPDLAGGKMNPDILGSEVTPGMGDNPPVAGQMRGAGAKVAGGGLEPGTTDFGSNTAPMGGGRGGVGTGSAKTGEIGSGGASQLTGGGQTGGPAGGQGNVSGWGDSGTLATGRPTQPDNRSAIGGPALPTAPPGGVQGNIGADIGGAARTASGTTSTGTLGGGTAGTGATRGGQRTTDLVEGRVAGPEGDVGGTGKMAAGAAPGKPNLHFNDANAAAGDRGGQAMPPSGARPEPPSPGTGGGTGT